MAVVGNTGVVSLYFTPSKYREFSVSCVSFEKLPIDYQPVTPFGETQAFLF